MVSYEQLMDLEKNGHSEESRDAARRALASVDLGERLSGSLFLIGAMKYEFFAEAVATLKPIKDQLADNFPICDALSYAAWYLGDDELCRWACGRCIALEQSSASGYLRLGMMEMIRQRHLEAFCTFSAGLMHCPKEISRLQTWYRLAKALTQGVQTVRFAFDGLEFQFRLNTFNGHAMESSCQHLGGHLCEEEELRHARAFVGQCDAVVEVGAAVGNHTVFFGKAFSPKTVDVFDANAPAVEHTRENVALNFSGPAAPKITVHHAAVGATPGHLRIFNQDVRVVRLDDELTHRVDFMKIDVDGMEMEVLEGCRGLIARDRPKIMIEVQNELKERFLAYIAAYGYRIEREIVRTADTNYFLRAAA